MSATQDIQIATDVRGAQPQSSPAKPKRDGRRNPRLTAATVRSIFEMMSEGKTFSHSCRQKKVTRNSIRLLIGSDKDLQSEYVRARENFADAVAESMFEIEKKEKDPIRARLMCDNRKWYVARTHPRQYGERLTQELVGKDGAALALPSGFVVEVIHSVKTPEMLKNAEPEALPEKTGA